MSEYKYEVRGFRKQTDCGSSVEIGCDTLKEAKTRARFVITERDMVQSEASQPLGYAQVVNRFTGEIVADYFNETVCQDCGRWHKGQSNFKCECRTESEAA